MLVEFRVENFLSFNEEVVFSTVAGTNKSEDKNPTVKVPEGLGIDRLLTTSVVYGANASGKSNLINAMLFMRVFVVLSAPQMQAGEAIKRAPFLLSKENNVKPTKFEIVFIHKNKRCTYGFSVNDQHVIDEWLYIFDHPGKGDGKRVFERHRNDKTEKESYQFGAKWKKELSPLMERTRNNALFVSAAAQWNSPTADLVMEWFISKWKVYLDEPPLNTSIEMAQKNKKQLLNYLRIADLGITDILYKDINGDKQLPPVSLFHQGKNQKGEVQNVPFDFHLESNGTKSFFRYTGIWEEALANGQTLVFDEFDAMLHPNLSKWLVKRFLDPKINRNGAQLILTTHNPELMDPKLLRRDQVWFTMKNSSGASELYSLLEFKPRKEEQFRRQYLQGSYGAVPILEDD